ncbi:unnamed protein product [Ostreobium quekettii]|uniref:[Histone H3]-trimethyl-L-lysine(4) demethylase n=1 Tax=Ostreobium quekettii TaxID=121088 RepID=A0A8S1ISU3_9CHLO|nr:unnamed protein product [Ostreobium quekettii]|eukprot:evm.model.scf_181EXC.7 EVM.evm.TU.scf_181EXC.7   scf_181EXC:30927-39882(+)
MEAPVFRPTEQEFADPLAFIAGVREAAEPCGICRIVPPPGWKPPFCLDPKRVRFRTRAQVLNQLQSRRLEACEADSFWAEYRKFAQGLGRPHQRNPILGGREVDLYRLSKAVSLRGGFEKVTAKKEWKDVARAVQVHLGNGNTSYSLRNLYQKHLLEFERHMAADGGAAATPPRTPSPPHRPGPAPHSEGPIANLCQAAAQMARQEGLQMPESAASRASSRRASLTSGDEEAVDALLVLGAAAEQLQEPKAKKSKFGQGDVSEVGGPSAALDTPLAPIRVPDNIHTLLCELCEGGHHENQIVLCDECDRGYHLFCMVPPLERVPEGDWFCPKCLAKKTERCAFKDGPELTLAEFSEMARAFERNYWGGAQAAQRVTPQKLEEEFWTIVEKGEDLVEVFYGADIDTKVHGSGFPKGQDTYGAHPWNLNNLPKNPNSLLKHIPDDIPGVVVPWMYVGMQFSSFCWHVEDHMFYSINYLHWGAPKRWYGVPSRGAAKLEEAMRTHLADQFDACPDLLFNLVTMMNPQVLRNCGVPVYEAIQEEGEFVVTFPNAYHAGFNMGLNCAEAVNFAPVDWLRFGKASCDRYRSFRRQGVVAHEELLLRAAQELQGAKASPLLQCEINRVVSSEALLRHRHWSNGLRKFVKIKSAIGLKEGDEEDATCSICRQYLHLSAVTCASCPGRYVCLLHMSQLCECNVSQYTLLYRHPLLQLEEISDSVRVKEEEVHTCGPEEAKVETKIEAKEDTSDGQVVGAMNRVGTPDDPVQVDAAGGVVDAASPPQRPVTVKFTFNGRKGKKRGREGTMLPNTETMASFRGFLAAWKQRAENVIKNGGSRVAEIDNLLNDSEQFLWAGSEVGDARKLREKLLSAKDWVATVKRCSGHRAKLEDLEKVVSWQPPPARFSNLSALRSLYEASRDWVARCAEQGDKVMSVDALEVLVTKGQSLNVDFPQLPGMETRLKNALDVRSTLQNILNMGPDSCGVRADAVHLRRLQQRASHAGVEMPELQGVQKLLEAVQKWQDKVRQRLGMTVPLPELRELLEEAMELRAYTPEVGTLQVLIKKAEDWSALAAASVKRQDSLKKMREVLHSGERLGVVMKEVEELRGVLRRREWEASAKRAQNNRQTIASLQEILAEAISFGAEDSELYAALSNRLTKAMAWNEQVSALMKALDDDSTHEGDKPSLEDLEALVKAGTALHLRMETMQRTTSLLASCNALKSRAAKIASRIGTTSPPHLEEAAKVFEDALGLKLKIPQLEELRTSFDKTTAWCGKARAVLEGWSTEPSGPALGELCGEAGGLHFKTDEMDDVLALDARMRIQALIGRVFADHVAADIPCGWNDQLVPLDVQHASPITALKAMFSDAVQAQTAGQRVSLPDRPEPEAGFALLRIAEEVGVSESIRSEVDQILQTAVHVQSQMKQALQAPSHNGFVAAKKTVDEVFSLLGEALKSPFRLEGIIELEEIIDKHRRWETRAKEVILRQDKARLPWSEAQGLIQELQKSPVSAGSLGERLSSFADNVKAFMDQLKCDVARPGGGSKMGQVFGHLVSSVRTVHRRVDCTDMGSTTDCNGHDAPRQTDDCLCFQSRGNEAALSCSDCKEWFHAKCVGAPVAQSKSKKWVCPLCQAARGHPEALAVCSGKLRKTGRPSLTKLEALLQGARALEVCIPEEEQLSEIVTLFNSWQARVLGLLDSNDEARKLQAGDAPAVPEAVLRSVLKGVLHVEVDASWLLERVSEALRSERWRRKAAATVKNSLKPPIDSLQRLLGEGCALHIDPSKDATFLSIQASVSQGRQWTDRAQTLYGDLRRCSGQPIDDRNSELLRRIRDHVAAAEAVPCRVDATLLEGLREKSMPYCLCATVYDENRPMLGCEFCDRWYHYECVGLKSPQEHEVDEEVAPDNYRCPHCCMEAAQAYPHCLQRDHADALARQYGRQAPERDSGSISGHMDGCKRENGDPCAGSVERGAASEAGTSDGGSPLLAGPSGGCAGGSGNGRPLGISPAAVDEFMVALGVPSAGGLVMTVEDQLRALDVLEQMIKNKKEELRAQLCGNGRR